MVLKPWAPLGVKDQVVNRIQLVSPYDAERLKEEMKLTYNIWSGAYASKEE